MPGVPSISSHVAIDMSAVGDVTPQTPAPARAAGPVTLSTSEAAAAWTGHTLQQASVSGVSWGFAQKVPGAVGSAAGAAIGGPIGAGVGALVGNVIGGALLGPTHHLMEVAAVKARRAIGHGFQFTPYTGDEKKVKNFRENAFIGTFSVVQGSKGIAKAVVSAGLSPFAAEFAKLGLDVVFSIGGGALAQGVSNLRKAMGRQGQFRYVESKDPALNGREAVNRLGAGSAAGTVRGLFDLSSKLVASGTAATPPTGTQLFGIGLQGGLKTAVTLCTWFKLRDTAAGIMPQALQSSRSATGARPPADELPHVLVAPDAVDGAGEEEAFHDALDSYGATAAGEVGVSWAEETIAAYDRSVATLREESASSTADVNEGGDVDKDESEEFADAQDHGDSEASATTASHENDRPVEREGRIAEDDARPDRR